VGAQRARYDSNSLREVGRSYGALVRNLRSSERKGEGRDCKVRVRGERKLLGKIRGGKRGREERECRDLPLMVGIKKREFTIGGG